MASFLGADNVIEGDVRSAGGGFSLHLQGGKFALPQRDMQVGAKKIMFRSDAVKIGAEDGLPGLKIPGRIAQVSYPGGCWRYAVDTPAGQFLVDGTRRVNAGDAVELMIPGDEMFVFPSTATAPQGA